MKMIGRLWLGWCIALGVARAQTATITPESTTLSAGGGSAAFAVTLQYPANTTAVGFEIAGAPAGWTFRSASGPNVPQIAPGAGDTAPFGFSYTTPPSQSAAFGFTLGYPAGLSGTQRFSGITATFFPGNRVVALSDVVLTASGTAPTITQQPVGAAIASGGSITFTVVATGTAPLSYQWQKDGAALAGATGASLQLNNASAAQAGSYAVVVSNGTGSVTSAAAVLTVSPAAVAPQIVTPPLSQSVNAGANVTFSVGASGTAPLSYQWRKDGIAIAGATAASLTLTNVSPTHAGAYSVVVTNGAGTATSAAAMLSVTPAPDPETPTSGVWFGNLANNAGSFALLLRPDRTGVFLGYLRQERRALIARELTLEARRISGVVEGGGAVLEASLAAGGALSGGIAQENVTLTSAGPAAAGATQALAGFYRAGAVGRWATGYAIAGGNGAIFVLISDAGLTDAGAGTFSPAGAIDVATESGRVGGAVNAANFTVAMIYTPASGASIAFSGADDAARGDTEKLINISTRSRAGGTAGELTAGFVLTGDQPKTLLVRGIGPALAGFGLAGALPAARLDIFRVSGGATLVASGADWGAGPDAAAIASAAARVGAFSLASGSKDAALLVTLQPGPYTAVVNGQGSAAGVALVEIYDATVGAIPRAQRLINISSRAVAGAGESALVAGFVIRGDVPKRVLVRAAGPALAAFGLSGTLAAPRLSVHAGETIVAQNAGWSDSPADASAIAAAARQVGAFAFAPASRDAAVLVYLSPGSYTAQVTSAGAPGVALLEVYEVP